MIRSFIYFMLLTLGIYSSNLYGFTVQSETVSTNTQSYSGSGAISDINVTVNFTSTYDNGNRYVGFSLISPSGTAVTLKRYDYGSGNTFSNTTFDDEASNQWTSGSVPYTGQYRPYEGSLSVFDGENPNGTWTFVVYNSRSETGSASWSLSISTTSGTGTTSPLGTAHSGSSFSVSSETVSTGTINITDVGTITDINVRVSFTSTYDNGNRYVGFSLISPSGTAVALKRYDYGAGSMFYHTNFDDEASNQWTSGGAAYTSNYRPYEGSLSVFDGESQVGTWTLVVYNSRSETGNIDSWSIFTTTNSSTPSSNTCCGEFSGGSFTVSGGITSTGFLSVPYSETITDINVRVSFTSTYDNGNRYVGFSLISPSGTAVALKRYDYGAGSMFYHTNFDDEASNQWTSGGAAYTSNYRPYEGSLSSLYGQNSGGTWQLQVYNSRSETGTIDSWSVLIKGQSPTVSITTTESSPTNTIPITVSFNESVTGFISSDVVVSSGSISGFTGSGTTYTFNVNPASDGTVTVDVPAGVAQDGMGNDNEAATQFSITYDGTGPIPTITSTASSPTNTIPITISFDESVFNFGSADVTIAPNSGGSIGDFSGSGTTYTLNVINLPSDGIITVNVPAGVCIDAAGNSNTAASEFSITYDSTKPTVIILTTSSISAPTNVSPIPITLNFSESVTNFEVADITVGNGVINSVSSISQYVGNWIATSEVTPAADGVVTLNIAEGVFTDAAGNGNTAANEFNWTYDGTSPTMTITATQGSDGFTSNDAALSLTFESSEATTDFVVGDITVSNGALSSFSATSSTVYTATFTPTSDGAVTINVPAGTYTDAATNGNTAATEFDWTYDGTSPTMTITATQGSDGFTSNDPSLSLTFESTEATSNFAVGDINVTNGALSSFTQTSSTVYTATFTPSAEGTVTINIAAGNFTDAAGNGNTAATEFNWTYDGRLLNVPADYATIQAGIDASVDGDTVMVAADTYTENINFNGKNIVVGSLYLITQDTSYISSTIIDGSNSGATPTIQNTGDDVEINISGFTIRNSQKKALLLHDYGTIKHCKFINNGISGEWGAISADYNITLEDCDFRGNIGQFPIAAGGSENKWTKFIRCRFFENEAYGEGAILYCENKVFVENCLFYNNTGDAIDIGMNGTDSSAQVINTTIVKNDGYGIQFPTWSGSYWSGINNCIIAHNTKGDINFYETINGSIIEFYNNIIPNGIDDILIPMFFDITFENNISGNPIFIDLDNDDFHLSDYSPAIGAGTATGAPTTDIEDNIRPNPAGSNPDMGAYENARSEPLPHNTKIYVSTDGNDNTVGLSSAPFATIQAAIDYSVDGDTVSVAAGTYNENINFNGKNIVVQGEDRETTIIDGNQAGSVVTFENGEDLTAVLGGFTIKNGRNGYPGNAGGIYCINSNATLNSLIVTNNNGDHDGGGLSFRNSTSVLNNVEITNNHAERSGGGITIGESHVSIYNSKLIGNMANIEGGGIFGGASTIIIENTLFLNNFGTQSEYFIHDISLFYSSVVHLTNNTIITTYEGQSIHFGNAVVLNITNCIIHSPSVENIYIPTYEENIYNEAISILTITNSNISNGLAAVSDNEMVSLNWGDGNIDSDSLFVDPDNGDYHLSDYSPAIGAGTATGAPSTDIEGNPRPNPAGSMPDMGAYENALGSPYILGCTDSDASNYDNTATHNNNSCTGYQDRAVGYLNNNSVTMSVSNYGALINWDTFPSGLWNGLTYVPMASIIVGLPGRDSNGDPHPWALRPDPDNPASSVYWGPTVSESWFDKTQDHILADWRPAVGANGNNFSGTVTAGEAYSGAWGIDGTNNTPLLANSSLESTWPGAWPGWINESEENLYGQNIYLELDDRYANQDVDTTQGYPTEIKVEIVASASDNSYLEDAIIYHVKMTNQSVYDYKDVYFGLYIDIDVPSVDANQSFAYHTNTDDMFGMNEEADLIYIYDQDGVSNGISDLAYSGFMFINTPEDVGLTGFRWFDWYTRPGVYSKESVSEPLIDAGDGWDNIAEDKEAIQYAMLSSQSDYPSENFSDWEWRGISSGPNPREADYNSWYFHSSNNPHFDSIDSFNEAHQINDNLDATCFVSSGPFNIDQGGSIELSFALVFGENESDLITNAQNIKLIAADHDPPLPTISSTLSSPTNAATIPITITFDEIVTGFDENDLSVGNGIISSFTGSDTTYTFSVTPTVDGAVTVDIAAGICTDVAGNSNTAVSQFSIEYMGSAPGATITSTLDSLTNISPIPITATFGKSVTGFEIDDLTITNGAASDFSGSGTSYTFNVTPAADGIVTVDIAAGICTDAAGNTNVPSSISLFYDTTAPSITLISPVTGDSLSIGSSKTINWQASDNYGVSNVDISHTIDNGVNWTDIIIDQADTSTYSWSIPNTPSEDVQIKFITTDVIGYTDTSYIQNLSIVIEYPKITSTYPEGNTLGWKDKELQVLFSQLVDNTTINSDNVTLTSSYSSSVSDSLIYNDTSGLLTISLSSSFSAVDTVTLTLKSGIKNLFGYGLDGNGDGTPGDDYNITYTTLMLGDYDTTGVLDLIDLAALVQGFKDKDYSYELAPFSGAVPHFTSSPDSSYDIEDLMAFGMTWNWQASLGRSLFRQWEDAGIDIAIETVHDLIYIDIPEGIIAYELQISYNPSHITIYSPENTGDINLTDNDEDSGIYTLLVVSEDEDILAVPITISGRETEIMLSFRAVGQDGEIITQLTRQLSLNAIPDNFALSQAYPNPFNPVTQIQYAIPEDIHVELIIYDILGRQIAELVNSKKEAGFYKTEWNGNQNASGIYIVKMTAGKYTDYQKLMLLK